jgi:RNA polymerase sigma-70 factor (ECF subfamily)
MAPRGAEAATSDLVQRALRGEDEAFDELVVAHERRVWSLAYQIVGNADDAREITQDVFLRVHQHLKSYDPSRPFGSWLYRIAVNCTYDYLRKRPDHDSLDDMDAPEHDPRLAAPARHPDAGLAGREVRQVLRHALRRLTPVERTVFLLRDVEGLATREIAFIVKCSTITVRRHSSNARLKLRQALGRRLPHLAGGSEESS